MRYPDDKKHSKRKIIVICVAAALALVVLMSVVLVLRCLTFDENGAHVIDRYGVLAAEGSSSGLVDYTRYTEGSAEAAQPEESDSGEQEQQAEETTADMQVPQDIRAVTVDAENLTYDDDYLNQLVSMASQGLIDTVIVDLKHSDGTLSVQVTSDALDTSSVQAVYSDEFPNAVQQLKSAGLRIIGRVYAFSDSKAVQTNSDLSCWYGSANTTWLDAENNPWMDPTDTQVVQYLCDIVQKGTEIGCDEILLQDFQFPTGQTDLITFDNQQDFSAAIEADLQQLIAAAGSVPVDLYLDDPQEDGTAIGQDLTALYDQVYRIVSPMTSEGDEGDTTAQTMIAQLASLTGGADKITPWYFDREAWSASTTTAVYDAQGDIYQLFYLTM